MNKPESLRQRFDNAASIGKTTLRNLTEHPMRAGAATSLAAGAMFGAVGCNSEANPNAGCYDATIVQGGVQNNILNDIDNRGFDINKLHGLQATGEEIQGEISADYSAHGVDTNDLLLGGETARYCIDNSGKIQSGYEVEINSAAVK